MADIAILDSLTESVEALASPPATGSCSSEAIDPRIRRTRELLQQALATLLDTRDFERISVQDITDAATVNRATFYAHYPDKFALLECLVAGRFQALLDARGVVFDGTCFGALQGFVLGVCDYLAQTLTQTQTQTLTQTQTQTLNQPATNRPLEPHLESAIISVLRRMLLHGVSQHPPAGTLPPGMIASTASWAIYGAAREWALTPNHPPAEQIAPTVVGLIEPILHGPPSCPKAA